MQEEKIYKFAFYNIDGKDYYQFLPTSNIEDVIYVKGMRYIQEKSFIKDGDIYVEIPHNDVTIGVGQILFSSEIVKRYKEGDPFFKRFADDIEYLESVPHKRWFIDGEGEASICVGNCYVGINHGEIPVTQIPNNIIKGEVHWYLELHDKDNIRYEKTLYDDKKYRGQVCDHYMLVKVLEYEVNGELRRVIIEKDDEKYSYHEVIQSSLDDIIDSAKGLISHEKKYEGFAGVSPLYTFNTENSACVFHDNQDLIDNNIVTTVTGSGDAILDLFLYGADKIISFDTNVLTIFYGELKFVAAKYLSFEDFCNLFSNLDIEIYKKIEGYLSDSTRKFWNELYEYSKNIDKQVKDPDNGGLFYPTSSLFSSNCTIYNENGYYNENNYLKLQEKLRSKTLEDISFVNCDLFELTDKVDLSNSSYVYLSNIMDFIVGVNSNSVNLEKLEEFKSFIVDMLLPKLKNDANIELSYINDNWHFGINNNLYPLVYPLEEGFDITRLSNGEARVLSFRSNLLKKIK